MIRHQKRRYHAVPTALADLSNRFATKSWKREMVQKMNGLPAHFAHPVGRTIRKIVQMSGQMYKPRCG